MIVERGEWRSLLYDISGINQHRDHSSGRVHRLHQVSRCHERRWTSADLI